jgi:palmitoyl-protein thioesterase
MKQPLRPQVYVHSVMTGGNVILDEIGGFLGNMNTQVEQACKQLKEDEKLMAASKLAGGVNAVGFSQGGQLMRAYVQRCNDPPVKTLITMGGQHMGIAEIPGCLGTNWVLLAPEWALRNNERIP